MRKFYAVLLLFIALDFTPAFSQLRYDDGPLLSGVSTNFVTVRSWGRNNITYSFINGTNDMPDNEAQQAVRQAFQIWADYANLNFTEVAANGDIRISWAVGDHGDGTDNAFDGINGVLAHAYFPPPNGGDIAGDMHFDEDEFWTTAAQAFPWQPIDLVTVAAHEIGHALGLDHSNINCALMNPFYNGSHRYLAPDDIDGIRTLYGARSPLNKSGLNCAGGTIFVNNLPDGATVTYQSSNTALATINTVNNQGIVTPATGASGLVQFTATITLPCGITWSDIVEVGIGAPGLLSATISSGSTSGFLMQCNTLSVLYAPGEYIGTVNVYDPVSTNVNWTFEGKSANAAIYIGDYPDPRNVTVRVKGLNAWSSYRLTRSNACGSSWSMHTFRANYACPTEVRRGVNEDDQTVTLSPNPAVNQVTIALKKNNAVITVPGNDDNERITAVKIYDMMGRLRKLQRYNKAGTVTINVSDLLNGIYFVEIFNGSTSIKRNLQIIR